MKSPRTEVLTPTPFQARVLALPEKLDGAPLNLMLAGGRGGGKSKLIQMILLRYCMDHGRNARALITRRRLKSMMQLQVELQELLQVAFGSVRWNQQTTSFTLPNGGTITLGCLDDRNLSDFSGLNVGMLICDEAGHSPTPETLAELMLTVRLDPMRIILAANPGGREHGNIVRRWMQGPSWKPLRDKAGLLWVNCPSTSVDNPHIDRESYKKMFQAMRGMDPSRADAMEHGSWTLHGDFFSAWGPQLVYDYTEMPPDVFRPIVSIDPGSYAPTAITLCGWTTEDVRLKDDRIIPRSSFIVHDSLYEFDEINQNLARGSGRSPKEIAPRIRSMLVRNYANDATLICDPAGGARVAGRLEPSIIQLYKQAGIPMRQAPRTRRVDGWTKMRELMRDGMFWVASRNTEWLDTVPGLPRSPHDAEDLDTDTVDHLADSTRYALMSQGTQIRSGCWK